jgi:hypothetical protein
MALMVFPGLPLCVLGARYGVRHAMDFERARAMRQASDGSLLSVPRAVFPVFGVVVGHALFGAICIAAGAYGASVLFLGVGRERAQLTLALCVCAALAVAVLGAVHQMRLHNRERSRGIPA